MKKTFILAMALLSLHSAAQAGEVMGKHGEAIGLSYVGTFIVTGVYASTGAGVAGVVALTTSGVVTTKDIQNRKAAAKLLLNDVQDFLQSGSLTINLQATVNALKSEDESLSDSEALDLLNDSALSILAE